MKGKEKLVYAVFRMSDDLKSVVIDEDRMGNSSDPGTTEVESYQSIFTGVIQDLPKDDGRYVIFDYHYKGSFGNTSKMILVLWAPNDISIKKKMLYASSKDALKKCFPDMGGEFQADCPEDLSHADIETKLKKI